MALPDNSSGDGCGKLNRGSLRRVAVVGPDPVQLVLVVERFEAEDEGEEQADNRAAGGLESGRALHVRDPLASPVDRDEWRDDDDPPEQHGNHRHRRAHLDSRKVPGFAVHLVIPDEEVDSESDEQWQKSVELLTSGSLLGLFREAVDLRSPDPAPACGRPGNQAGEDL